MSSETLLDTGAVAAYLVTRGLLPGGSPATARALGGGVSNVVLLVECAGRELVVKQSLPMLRVSDEWFAEPGRVLTEAAALQVAERLIPGSVPTVLDIDGCEHAITLAAATTAHSWKDELLAGHVNVDLARGLGEWLAQWHSRTAGLPSAELVPFQDRDALRQLRLDPYFRAAAAREPSLADALLDVVVHLERTQECLVHGDFSPKNVLAFNGQRWVIDFEVAHQGDPAFDVAFMLSHLMMKAIHRPDARRRLADAADAFRAAYTASASTTLRDSASDHLAWLIGALLVARVYGKSTAEYLTAEQAAVVGRLGRRLLLEPDTVDLHDWTELDLG